MASTILKYLLDIETTCENASDVENPVEELFVSVKKSNKQIITLKGDFIQID